MYVSSLVDVDLDDLVSRGIKAIMLDLDNTILPWKDHNVPVQSAKWVRNALDRGIKLCIASNTHNPARLRAVAEELGIPCRDKLIKPRRKGLREVMESMEATPETTAIIGDQILTDIIGGNRLSILTILVKPMHRKEFIGTKFSRLLEHRIMAYLLKKGMLGTKAPDKASEIQE
ncbi:MAG: YqeG family HAD IIIA-type phosphatase [Armatimonadota bacterium]